MIAKYTATVLLILTGVMPVLAQQLTVVDATTQKPVQGALLQVSSSAQGVSINMVTNAQGIATPKTRLVADSSMQILVRHVAYETLELKGVAQWPATIALQPAQYALDDVVVTGQYSARSAEDAVYAVRVINAERLQKQGATSLQQVLSTELNVRFGRDNALGTHAIALQGISGQNVKVLLDGVPVVGRSGIANEVDLSQINVHSIERIEIIEGPMAVNYGADALAGVINIITKKTITNPVEIQVGMHAESVGPEYGFNEQGINNPFFTAGYSLGKRWYAQTEGSFNHFGGWRGTATGREKDWHPKAQWQGGQMLRYSHNNFSAYYRLDYLHERIINRGPAVNSDPLRDPFALDEDYVSTRLGHQLHTNLDFTNGGNLETVLSYTDYQRNTEAYSTNLVTNQTNMLDSEEQDSIYYRSVFARSTLHNGIALKGIQTQIGLELNHEIAGGTTLNEGDKQATNTAVFASAEIPLLGSLLLRPGFRYTHNSIFSAAPMPSVNLKWQPSSGTSIRLGYGRGFRAPSTRELFHEFIDANHRLIGNPDLSPEYSHNFNGSISQDIDIKQGKLGLVLNGFYNNIQDRIGFINTTGANPSTTYRNISSFKTQGVNLRLTYQLSNFKLVGGMAYMGLFQQLSNSYEQEVPNFLYTPETTIQLTYTVPNTGLTFNSFYKYTGARRDYIINQNISSEPVIQRIDDFHWLDLSLSKQWNNLNVSAGVRNATNVQNLALQNAAGGAHSGSSNGGMAMAYGRSYYARIVYSINLTR